MCLIVVAWQHHPDYPLIVVANRDEYYQRPTAPLAFWDDKPSILGGRDLSGGGTWLGLNRQGRFAAVTNYREGRPETAPRSRGELVTGFLGGDSDIHQYAMQTVDNGEQYNGFNLLLSEGEQLVYCSNRQTEIQLATPGIYTLSNHLLNSPWPKAVHAKDTLAPLLSSGTTIDPDRLIQCLQRRQPFPDEHLPDTGIGLEMERMLSPPFILSRDYGTRCTTVVLQSRHGGTQLIEQSYHRDGSQESRRELSTQ